MEESHVFISYSRSDRKKVDWISRQLTSSGYEIWIDRHDIPGGVEWEASIVEAIKNAEAFILILSPVSIASAEVKKELLVALKNKIRIIPVILHPIDFNWLKRNKISKFQVIQYYRRRQASIVELIKSLGGLRGAAALMPKKSNLAMRENTRLMVELIRLVQEVSPEGGYLIFEGGDEWQYYIQFLLQRDSPEVYVEAVGNTNIDVEYQLDSDRIKALQAMGWQEPKKDSSGNYWQKWQVHTDRDRSTVAVTVMNTFLDIYRHYRGEYLNLVKIDLD